MAVIARAFFHRSSSIMVPSQIEAAFFDAFTFDFDGFFSSAGGRAWRFKKAVSGWKTYDIAHSISTY
jgi:hypothetical protein